MLNEDCRIQSNQHNTLIVRKLQNHAKNRVIAANVCVVEKKRVDLAIDCLPISQHIATPPSAPSMQGLLSGWK